MITLLAATFAYESSDKNTFTNLDMTFSGAWTGLIGANGCGKSTLLRVLAGELELTAGELVGRVGFAYRCEQETSAPPAEWEDFLMAYDKRASELKTAMALHELHGSAWQELSNGEQKRMQLACALWRHPDLLLLDEPTNHLDAENRRFIIAALRSYKGIGVLVSHDRELLNALCHKCIFFVGERTYAISGAYDAAKAELDAQFAHVEQQRAVVKQRTAKLQQEVQRLNELSQASKGRLSKRGIDRKDHDAKGRIDAARLTGKDASFGQKKVSLAQRATRLGEELADMPVNKDYAGSLSFAAEARASKVLLHCQLASIALPNGRNLFLPELVLRAGDKVGLVGLNGVGKSSFLRYLQDSGLLKAQRSYHLHQELSAVDTQSLRSDLASLTSEAYARCLQIVARFGSDAKQIIKSEHWSAGEARKVAIALAIVNGVEFLILDEPTNHLDLPSVQNLEAALEGSGIGLLIVSHDANFIAHVCREVWEISREGTGDSRLVVRA